MFFIFYKKNLIIFLFLQLFANYLLFSLIFTYLRFMQTAQRCKFNIFETCRSSSRAITQCSNFYIFKSAASRMRCSVIITQAIVILLDTTSNFSTNFKL